MLGAVIAQNRAKKERERKKRILLQTEEGYEPVPKALTVDEYYEQILEEIPSELFAKIAFVQFGTRCRRLIEHRWFVLALNLVITTAGILVGIQTYPKYAENDMIDKLDVAILSIFSAECILKVFADPLRPWNYFVGENAAWNIFDFLIVLSCMPFMPFGSAAAALRLLRLLRVLKLLRAVPQMRMIIAGLLAGMQNAIFILVLILIIFYMFAVCGVMLFAKQDPWNFGNLGNAFTTLFRLSTYEDWTDVMYMNYYGCDKYSAGGGTIYVTASALAAKNRTLAKFETLCDPKASPITAFLYFHSFILVSALILLSMLVGAMAIAMIGVLDEIKEEAQTSGKAKAVLAKQQLYDRLKKGTSHQSDDTGSAPKLIVGERQRVHYICKALAIALGSDVEKSFLTQETEQLHARCGKAYVFLAVRCRQMAHSSWFSNFIACVIVFASVLVGLQTDGVVAENSALESAIIGVFVFEVVLKIIGEMTTPFRYFDDAWNRFDFFVVAICFLPTGGAAVIMRVMRLLRVLKLLSVVPKLQIIVVTILNSFNSIIYIGALLVLCFYMFAVTGNVLFSQNDPWHFGNVHLAMMSLFRASTGEDWTDIMYINELGCDGFDGYPYNTYPEMCTHPVARGILAVAFFEIFMLLCGMILLTLFIGIICAEMDFMSESQHSASVNKALVATFQKEHGISEGQIGAYTKLFATIQDLKSGFEATVDLIELKGILELLAILQQRANPAEEMEVINADKLKEVFHKFDEDDGGDLDLFEFVKMMHSMKVRKQDAKKRSFTCVNDEVVDLIFVSNRITFMENGAGHTIEQLSRRVSTFVVAGAKEVEKRGSIINAAGKRGSVMMQGVMQDSLLMRFGDWCERVTTAHWFNTFMLSIVIVASLLVGVQVGYGLDDSTVLGVLDLTVLAIFTLECAMKMLSRPYAPWEYFTNEEWAWNCFDFLIVVLSMPGIIGSQAAALRLLRLARIVKIIELIPMLKVIIVGIMSGLSACGYIMLLMGIVFYIYAVLGVSIFSANDPWHFASLGVAFESLFRSATLEDWTDLWYTNYYGCNAHDNGFYTAVTEAVPQLLADPGSYCSANGLNISSCGANSRCVIFSAKPSGWYGCECTENYVPAVTGAHSASFPYTSSNNYSFGTLSGGGSAMSCVAADPQYSHMPALPKGEYYCEDDAKPVITTVYFVSFVMVSAFILISLFVGSVLISIMDAVAAIDEKVQEGKTEHHARKVKLAYLDSLSRRGLNRKQAVGRAILEAWEQCSETLKVYSFGKTHSAVLQQLATLQSSLHSNAKTKEATARAERDKKRLWHEIALSGRSMDDLLMSADVPRPPVLDLTLDVNAAERAKYGVLQRKYFQLSVVCEQIANDWVFQGFVTSCIVIASIMVGVQSAMTDWESNLGLLLLEHAISAIFLFELLVKVGAEGFAPWRYFLSGWNKLDFVVVVGSYSPVGSLALILRMVRLLRVLKFLKALPELRMLVSALLSAVGSITYTCLLMFIYYYCMAIVFIILFQQNDPWHFANLHVTLMTLFRIATGDDWTDVMYTAQYGCDVYYSAPSDGFCPSPHSFGFVAVLMFVLFFIMGSLVFLNLFIGVVTAGMATAITEMENDLIAARRIKMLQERPGGLDLSLPVCDSLNQAFNLLDTDGRNRLDAIDVQFAFSCLNVTLKREQVMDLLLQCNKLLCELEGEEFNPDAEDEALDRGEWCLMLTMDGICDQLQSAYAANTISGVPSHPPATADKPEVWSQNPMVGKHQITEI
jgi:voltage-gated sodium channel